MKPQYLWPLFFMVAKLAKKLVYKFETYRIIEKYDVTSQAISSMALGNTVAI